MCFVLLFINSRMDDKFNEPKRSNHASRRSSLLEIIFGPQVSDVINGSNELPESTLVRAIDLKIEQEKTKQQYYKLANMDKCLELMKVAKGYGVPPQHLIHFVNNDLSPTNTANNNNNKQTRTPPTQETSNKGNGPIVTSNFNSPYKFPPTDPLKANNNNNNNNSNGLQSERRTYHRRTNSPARIGANAVAALSDSITIKEEESTELESPLHSKLAIPMNTDNSGTNTHNRNLSLPTMNKFLNPSIPTNMTSILNFDEDATESNVLTRNSPENSKRLSIVVNSTTNDSPIHSTLPLVTGTNNVLKRPFPVRTSSGNNNNNNIQKKIHRRTRSATVIPSFGVIDLNVIDQRANESRSHTPNNINNNNNNNNNLINTNNNDTCSESSSTKGNDSPIKLSIYQQPSHRCQHSSSVNRLLNDC